MTDNYSEQDNEQDDVPMKWAYLSPKDASTELFRRVREAHPNLYIAQLDPRKVTNPTAAIVRGNKMSKSKDGYIVARRDKFTYVGTCTFKAVYTSLSLNDAKNVFTPYGVDVSPYSINVPDGGYAYHLKYPRE